MDTAGIIAALDVMNAAAILIQNATAERRDVSQEELNGLSDNLQLKINSFQAKLDADPGVSP